MLVNRFDVTNVQNDIHLKKYANKLIPRSKILNYSHYYGYSDSESQFLCCLENPSHHRSLLVTLETYR